MRVHKQSALSKQKFQGIKPLATYYYYAQFQMQGQAQQVIDDTVITKKNTACEADGLQNWSFKEISKSIQKGSLPLN